MYRIAIRIYVLLALFAGSFVYAADWGGFRGADRLGISRENNLLEQWPPGGPKELWTVQGLGIGYSSAAIANGMVYTTGLDPVSKEGFLFAFDLQGKPKWKKSYGPEWKGSFKGARTTPTIENDRVYVISGYAVVKCFDAKTGDQKWSYDAGSEFKTKKLTWGISESVLIYKDNVICCPCGDDASVIALDKMTGKLAWVCKDAIQTAGYCSPIVIRHGNRDIIVNMMQSNLVGIDANTGKLLWQSKVPEPDAGFGADNNPVCPVYKDGFLYSTSGYGKGGVMYKIAPDGNSISKVWEDKTLDVHHGGVVLIDGYIYGASWDGNSKGSWVCLDFKTGKVMYDEKWLGYKGSIIAAGEMLYCWEETKGNIALVKANPKKFQIVSTFRVEKGDKEYWAHPSISDGVLYLRHGDVMMAYDIKKK
ncbi:MAG: PQQ-binding-like beta-propeller repeat protein [Phycisphaerae bacterium]|nr:PQQ-binding-like beta-propeller repeat protein [Phycisphaerae bacterium]